jgi:predicted enzyme related to lactoylglutathione lyase
LRLPGLEAVERGPTLEIFTYRQLVEAPPAAANRVGFGHIAFGVTDVAEAREQVLTAGGSAVGDIVAHMTPDGRGVTWCYLRDPEGNIIELQASTDPAA